ncbi:MAG: hypothetical protein JW720_12295 [Sedimentisphaerales bacterium]|nr:hypothetical protein [Sedimentisphaerales bacterium]
MGGMILGLLSEDMAFGVFAFSAIVCLGLSFLTVCLVKPLGNKLLLQGILVALTAFVFLATMPNVSRLATIMMIMAVILVITGLVCSVISHFSRPKAGASASGD